MYGRLLNTRRRRPRLALALGSGGARGLAHIGVLGVLEKEGVKPDLIVGSSIGAIIGALAVQCGSAQEIEDRARAFLDSEYFLSLELQHFVRHSREDNMAAVLEDWTGLLRHHLRMGKSLIRTGALPQNVLADGLARLLADGPIEELRPHLACVTTGLISAAPLIIDTGPLISAVAASCTIPGVFEAVETRGEMYVDGGVTSAVPVVEARTLGARRILAVDVRRSVHDDELPENGAEILMRIGDIAVRHCGTVALREADAVIRPDVGRYHWADFDKADTIIELGRAAAEKSMKEIHRL